MLGTDSRALKIIWTCFLFGLVVAFVYSIRETLVTVTLAIFFALLLAPIVAAVERGSPHWVPRTAALAIVYVALLGLIAAILIPLSSRLAEDARTLSQKLPAIGPGFLERIPLPAILEPVRDRIAMELTARLDQLESNAVPLLSGAFEHLIGGLTILAGLVVVPILAFFLLKDGRTLYAHVITSLGGNQRILAIEIYADLRVLLAQYVRTLIVLSTITLVCYGMFLGFSGAPYFVLLAGIAGVCEIVPAFGPFVAGLLTLIVVAVSGYPHTLLLFIFLVVYRVFLDYVISPALMGSGVQVPPLMLLVGALAGAELAGIPGVFFSVPVMAAVRVVLVRLQKAQFEPPPRFTS